MAPKKDKAILKALEDELNKNKDTKNLDKNNLRDLLSQLNLADIASGSAGVGQGNKKDLGQHKFWSTQPVSLPQEGTLDGPIDPTTDITKFRKEPYPLPNDYEWVDLDLNNEQEVRILSLLVSAFNHHPARRRQRTSLSKLCRR